MRVKGVTLSAHSWPKRALACQASGLKRVREAPVARYTPRVLVLQK